MAAVQVETPDLPRLKLDSIIGFSGTCHSNLGKRQVYTFSRRAFLDLYKV